MIDGKLSWKEKVKKKTLFSFQKDIRNKFGVFLTWWIASACFWVSRQKAPCFLYSAPPLPITFDFLPQSASASVNDGLICEQRRSKNPVNEQSHEIVIDLLYISTWIRKIVWRVEKNAWLIAVHFHCPTRLGMKNSCYECKRLWRAWNEAEVVVISVSGSLRDGSAEVDW